MIGYFDCSSGAGGDMIVASLLDAGLDREFLLGQLGTLGIDALKIDISETKRCGIRALRFEPVIKHEHHHRNLEVITKMINQSGISSTAKKRAIEVFNRLGAAEAKVHGTDINSVHFHEVGAVDSIIDIVSACVGFEALGIDELYCSILSVGGGTVKAAHGVMSVPAPATAELIKDVPVKGGPAEVELLTPTAAAILTTFSSGFGVMPGMKVEKTGYGAGKRELSEIPNVLRLMIGESSDKNDETTDTVCLIEANIDDCTGEVIGNSFSKFFGAGALDVYTTAITMKDNRPAVKISVICRNCDAEKTGKIFLDQGLSFGFRMQSLERRKLSREFVEVETKFGNIPMKIGRLDGKPVNAKPEFVKCKEAAQAHNVPVKEVIEVAMAEFKKKQALL